MPPAPRRLAGPQTPEQLASAIEEFISEHPLAVVLEDGRVLFDFRDAKYSLSAEHKRCTLHLWNEERNFVRRVVSTELRNGVLRLATMRFGQARPQTLELAADRDRRTPSTREAARKKYLRVLERVLLRQFPDWKAENFRAAMDLEKSFGPAYARGVLVRGQQAWAVIAVNADETQATIDGILTLGILWLVDCREVGSGKRVFQGLRVIVPRGCGALTLLRLAWLNPKAAQWELWELDERSEELEQRDAADSGNLATKLIHAPNENAARERFAAAAEKVMTLVPPAMRESVEQHVRSATEIAFLLHGLEFARARMGLSANSFERVLEITFGAGANETALSPENETELRELVQRLFESRSAENKSGVAKNPLYRMQPERWLESMLRKDVSVLSGALGPKLDARHVYAQVPAFAASDRGMLDLLAVADDGRVAVIELKADEDLHLALQGLDYWVRVRWHHMQLPVYSGQNATTGLGEFQRHGYFPGVRLSPDPPRLFLVAPSLRIHPATEVVLKHLKPEVEWTLAALDERWRREVKVVWRKHSRERA